MSITIQQLQDRINKLQDILDYANDNNMNTIDMPFANMDSYEDLDEALNPRINLATIPGTITHMFQHNMQFLENSCKTAEDVANFVANIFSKNGIRSDRKTLEQPGDVHTKTEWTAALIVDKLRNAGTLFAAMYYYTNILCKGSGHGSLYSYKRFNEAQQLRTRGRNAEIAEALRTPDVSNVAAAKFQRFFGPVC